MTRPYLRGHSTMKKFCLSGIVCLFVLSAAPVNAANLPLPKRGIDMCGIPKSKLLDDVYYRGTVFFRGTIEYWLEYRESLVHPDRRFVALVKQKNPAVLWPGRCKDHQLVAFRWLPAGMAHSTLSFDCNILVGSPYPTNEIWFGYVGKNKGAGLHEPRIAWRINTYEEDGSWFRQYGGERKLCTVLPRKTER